MDLHELDETHSPAGVNAPLSVAVCIGTFNQAQYLRGCIESVVAQTYPIHEIWVSDDASTDDTPHVMKEICKLYSTVRYFRQPSNLGPTENLSWVLAQPSTDLVVRLDSDDRLEPTGVAILADLMRLYPEAGYVHGNVYEIDADGVRTRTRRLARVAAYEGPDEAIRSNTPGYRVAANCGILFRSSVLEKANYYHRNYLWKAAEDWDLCLRIAILGWGNVHAAAVIASYRVWSDTQGARFKRKMAEISNLIDLYKGTIGPEYIKRGWNRAKLTRCMRRWALAYVSDLDSPFFSDTERESYKVLLRQLGGSSWLSVRIYLAERGLNPVFRSIARAKMRTKDLIKGCLLLVKR